MPLPRRSDSNYRQGVAIARAFGESFLLQILPLGADDDFLRCNGRMLLSDDSAVIPERCDADLLPWYEAIVPTSSSVESVTKSTT